MGMYDTIRLSLDDDFRVRRDANVTVQPAPIQYADGATKTTWDSPLFRWENNDVQLGARAYINVSDCNVTFVPRLSEMQRFETRCVVQFNAAKMATGSNRQKLRRAEFEDLYRGFNDRLASLGVDADWSAARVGRIDVGLNLSTQHPESDYIALLRKLPARKRLRRVFYDDESILLRNKSSQFAIYNKRLESYRDLTAKMRANIAPLLRMERRALKPRVVRQAFDVHTFDDLRAKFGSICETGLSEIRSLFNLDLAEPTLFDTEAGIIQAFESHRSSGERNWRQRALADIAYAAMGRVISRNRLYDLLRDMGVAGSALNATRREFDIALFSNTVRDERRKLFAELRDALQRETVE